MIIIGSTAIKYWFTDFNREPKDFDIILYEDEPLSKEFESNGYKVETLLNPILLQFCKQDLSQVSPYLNPNSLYTLKMSHMFWNLNWDKHMFDIQFLRKKGCQLNIDLFTDLYQYWNEFHGKNKRSDLKMTSDDFFNNVLDYPILHDDMHQILVQHEYFENKVPTYTKILKDNCEVEVCETKFNQLSHTEKCNLVIEEVMIMAEERYNTFPYRIAYGKMLMKFVISHAPIWEAIFIIENYIELHKCPFNFNKFFNK